MRAADQPALEIAVRVGQTFGECYECAFERTDMHEGNRLKPAIPRHAFGPGRNGNGGTRRSEALCVEGVAIDAVMTLKGDIGGVLRRRAFDQRHAFRVALAVVEERLPALAEQRADGGVA